jgi:hypothetical protein
MRAWSVLLLSLCCLSFSHSGMMQPAENKNDPAKWLPGNTLFYVETAQPKVLAQEWENGLAGSALGDYPFSMQKLQGNMQGGGPDWLMPLGLALSPDGLKEMQKMPGAAWAVTGIDSLGRPQQVAILLTGDSPLPGLLLRQALASGRWQEQTVVAGIKVYRHQGMSPMPGWGGAGVPGQPGLSEMHDQALALLPNAIVLGSQEAVNDVLKRSQGQATSGTLADLEAFKRLRQGYTQKPGLFAYAATSNLPEQRPLLRRVVNPNAIPHAAGQIIFQDGTLAFDGVLELDSEFRSPMVEAIPTGSLSPAFLHFVPKNATVAIATANPDGGKRWERFLDLLDGAVKLSDANVRLPSRMLDRLEDELQFSFGKELAPKITQAAFVLTGLNAQPSDAKPLIVLEALDEEEAKKWVAEILPRWASLGRTKPITPTVQEKNGQVVTLFTLTEAQYLAVGRHQRILVIGFNQDAVAASMEAGVRQQGLGSVKGVATLFTVKGKDKEQTIDGPGLVVAVKPAVLVGAANPAIRELFGLGNPIAAMPGAGGFGAPQVQGIGGPAAMPGGMQIQLPGMGQPAQAAQVTPTLRQLLEVQDHLVLGVTRQPQRILLRMNAIPTKPVLGLLSDAWLEGQLQLTPSMGVMPGMQGMPPRLVPGGVPGIAPQAFPIQPGAAPPPQGGNQMKPVPLPKPNAIPQGNAG